MEKIRKQSKKLAQWVENLILKDLLYIQKVMLRVNRKYRVQVGSSWSYNLKTCSIFKLMVRGELTKGVSA